MEPVAFPESAEPLLIGLGVATLLYVVVELYVLHFRRRALRLAEARTAALGMLSVGFAAGVAVPERLWKAANATLSERKEAQKRHRVYQTYALTGHVVHLHPDAVEE